LSAAEQDCEDKIDAEAEGFKLMGELPRLWVDFNELLEHNLVLLSKQDTKMDAKGNLVHLFEGLAVSIFDDDLDASGKPDALVAQGVVERNRDEGWSKHVKWCCRINAEGIRNQSDLAR
jgi:hypothetical protein